MRTVSRGFTFAETLVTVAILVVSVGLAFQLLFSSTALAQRQRASDDHLRSLLRMKTELLTLTSSILPPPWAPIEGVFVDNGKTLTMKFVTGDSTLTAEVFGDNQGFIHWIDSSGEKVWGPWPGSLVRPWVLEGRVCGIAVSLKNDGKDSDLHFPWGAWPL